MPTHPERERWTSDPGMIPTALLRWFT